MANTYTKIYIHLVFATETRDSMIRSDMQAELYAYTAGIVKELKYFFHCIGGTEDHIHLLVGMNPDLALSDFVQKVKANTSRFINEKGWLTGTFRWQNGFGAFSVAQSQLEMVRSYIKNQDQHHHSLSFKDEYETLLQRYQIDYDTKYVFK